MNMFQSKHTTDHGFSFAELAIVFVMMGLMMLPLYSIIFNISQLKPDDERLEIIQEGLAEYVRVTGTFPCPADIELDIENDAAAFQADCSIPAVAGANAGNDVLIGAVPIDDIRAVVGCGDVATLAAFSGDVLSSIKDSMYSVKEVFIDESSVLAGGTGRGKGAVDGEGDDVASDRVENIRCPLREYLANENHYKFIYAVTEAATVPGFDYFDPASVAEIEIRDTLGNQATSNFQIYALVDVGDDGKGGWNEDGSLVGSSNQGVSYDDAKFDCTDPNNGVDGDNCDLTDAIFIAAPNNDRIGTNFYNDTIDFDISGFMSEQSFWQWGNASGGNRDMVLNKKTRLIIDPDDPTNTSFTPDAADAVVVNRGDVRVENDGTSGGNIKIKTDTSTTDPSVQAGSIKQEIDTTANPRINAKKEVIAPKFCYKDSLVC